MSGKFKKRALYTGIGFVTFILLALLYIYFFVLGYIPVESKRSLKTQSISSQVDVYRDHHGVPHIYAQTTNDVMFASGYTMAEDRLMQIEMIVRTGKGRLSEVLGGSLLNYDKRNLLHGYTEAERTQMINDMPEQEREAFLAMVRGINAYVSEAKANPKEKSPIEFSFLKIDLAPYKPEDILAGIRVIIRMFGSGGGTELTNQAFLQDMIKKHGDDTARIIFDDILALTDPDAYVTSLDALQTTALPPSTRGFTQLSDAGIQKAQSYRQQQNATTDALKVLGLSRGASRTIVIGPERSATGNPLMMQATADGGDMHLVTPEFNFAGLVISPFGLPVMGRSLSSGMLITTGERDTRDTFVVKTDPDNPQRYFYKNEWLDMERRLITIPVKGQEDVQHEILRTIHGPVIMVDEDENTAYTQRWAIWKQEANIWASTLHTMKADTADEYAQLLDTISSSNTNISYADASGSFGFRHMGDLPVRDPNVDPRLPANGDGSENWQGFVGSELMPKLRDPEKGYIFIWNNSPAPNTIYGDGARWGKHFRTHLPVALIESKDKISIEDLKTFNKMIGASFYSIDLTLTTPRFFDTVLQEAARTTDDPKILEAISLIGQWDGLFTDSDDDGFYDNAGLTLFRKWLPIALETVFDDDIGTWWKDLDDDLYIPYQTSLLIRALEGEDAGLPMEYDYFNNRNRSEVIIESLKRTIEALEADHGGKPLSEWKQPVFWIHLSYSAVKGSDKPRILRYRSTMYEGAATRLRYLPKAVEDNGMPGWTAIMEITDEDPHYLSAIPSGGQSWLINKKLKASPHINDQYQKHAQFEYKTVSLNAEKNKTDYESHLVISPE